MSAAKIAAILRFMKTGPGAISYRGRMPPEDAGCNRVSALVGAVLFSYTEGLAPHAALMQRGRIELALDALEMIEPLDRAVEF
jgi:hypothetical protein